MKKGIIFILVLMLTVSMVYAEKAAPVQYNPADHPAPTRQGGDTVASALVIGGLPFNDFGTTTGYVNDYDEVCPYTGSTSPDVVYSFTPAGDVINGFVSLCGDTDYDSKLYIYENAVTPGTPFACNDDECTSALGQSYVSELTGLTFAGGNTYYIVVDGYGGNDGNYEIDITGDATTMTYTIDLTDDYGDGWNGGYMDVTVSGVVVLDDITLATGYGPATFSFDVEDGDLVELDYVEGGWGYENAYYVYDDIGTLVVSSGDGGVTPAAHVEFLIGAGPSGDTCEDAIAIGEVTDLPFDTSTSTASGFGTYITSNDLFYVFTAAASGTITVDLCDSSFDTKLAIYGECDAATVLATNDDTSYCGGSYTAQSAIEDLAVEGGEDYYIQVGGYSSYSGPGDLTVVFTLGGDTCEDAIAIGEVTDLPFDTSVATASGFGTYISSQDLFYVYTAEADGSIYVGLCDSSFDTKLAIYGACDAATEIATNDDSCGLQSELFDIAVVTGEDYFIQVGGYGTSAGAGVLDVTFTSSYVPEPPTNLFVTEEAYATWEAPGGGGGDALYSQWDYVSTEGGVSSQDFETAYDQYDAEGADEFVVPAGETWTINEVAILGSFSAAGPCTLANVRFFEDAAGMPGTLLFEYLDVPANFDVDGNFDCSFDDTILAEGTYWIGVQGRLDFATGGQWFWTRQAAPTIGYEFHWQNPGDGFGSGFTTWVAGSIQWPGQNDYNLSFALFGSTSDGDNVIVKSNDNRIDVSDNVYVAEMDPRMLKKGPQATGAGSPGGALLSREFIGYNLYIDGVFDGSTTELFYQYEGLVGGTEYLAQVTADYDEGESDPIDYTFTFVGSDTPAVFFSEYIEGSSNNKAIEIYNGTGDVINLDDFRIAQSVNGGGWAYWHIFPAGATLADLDVWVILNDGTDPALFDPANADEFLSYPSVVHHNGDDARGLEYTADGGTTWTLIDIIGDPDVDPGDGWDVAGITAATQNHTLVRKEAIVTGNIDWIVSAGTNATDSEWEVYDIDTFDYLGQHPGGGGGQPEIVVTPMSINETLEPDEIVIVPVTIENTGTEELTFDITVVETADALGRRPSVHTAPAAYDLANIETDPNMVEFENPYSSDVLFDLQFQYPTGVSTGEAGVETDGNYIYTPLWNGTEYCRYAMDGTFIETFTVAGTASVRDLAYDGQYFYGAAASTSLYQMDFTPGAEALISTITAPVACRAIAYDDAVDGFWANNWSTDITQFDMSGTVLSSFPCQTAVSFYGFAYDDFSDGGPFLWGFSQSPQNTLIQFDLATQLETGVTFDVGALVGTTTGMSGGMFIADGIVPGFVTIGCMIQNEWIVGLELCPGDEPWITVEPLTGTVPAGTSVVVDVTLDATDLASGTIKTADIIIANNAGDDVIVDVTMEVDGGAVFVDPPTNVSVDDELGIVSWYPPANTLIFDDFDSYSVGDHIAEVSTDWTTWSGTPGGAEDGVISDAYSLSPNNSLLIEGTNDQVLVMDNYFSGIYSIEVNLYIPAGNSGYWNLQKTNVAGIEWAFQILFETDGVATADAGAAAALVFDYDFDTWINMELIVDLNDDWCDIYVDGDLVFGYVWTLGTFGTPGLLQFGGMNLYASGGAPACYYDDIRLTELVPATDELLGYNVWLDGDMQNTGVVTDLEYTYAGLVEDVTYMAGVSAVYDEGESDIVEVEFTYNPDFNFLTPNNPAAVVEDYNDVLVTWELPGGAVEELSHHGEYDLNGIGTGGAVDFICAARFTADELADYYGGWSITGVNILLHSMDFSYVAIQVYEGGSVGDPGTLVYEEDVTSVAVMGEFTPHLLSTPVPLVAGNEYWLAYDMSATGDHPAAVDAGPMLPGKGAWMYFSGVWQELLDLGATLDFNWIITGFVSQTDAVASKDTKRTELIGRTHNINSRATFEAEFAYDSRRTATQQSSSRSLAGYYVYRDGTEIAVIDDPAILSYLDESLDAGTYEYTIEAYYTNPDGVSDPTEAVEATVVLDPPINVEASSQPPNIIVTWDAPARGIDSYNVYRDGAVIAEDIVGLMHIDINVPTGTYIYNVTVVYDGGYESELSDDYEVAHDDANGVLKPIVTELTGNYPNPFNPTTKISFSLKEAGHVSINIYNMRGQLVKTLVNAELDRDFHEIVWNGRDNSGKNTASGVYFYKMKAQNYNSTKKMILMK